MKRDKKIDQKMTPRPYLVAKDTPVKAAADLMKSAGIRHLPVMDGGKVVGVVSDRDLRQAVALSDRVSLLVAEVMSDKPYCVKSGTGLAEVAREMGRMKYGSAVVLDEGNHVIGIFTTTDAMSVLGELLADTPRSKFLLGIEKYLSDDYLI